EIGRRNRAEYEDFEFSDVTTNYVDIIDSAGDWAYHGLIGNDIGYIYLPEIHDIPDDWDGYLTAVLEGFSNTKGLIIDARDNDGGEDESARRIAGYLTDIERPYMRSQYKIGPGPDDYAPWREWSIIPVTDKPYLKPIILLTNRYTFSAGETFTLAMRTIPHVTIMGDTTGGGFSDAVERQLPNGWLYRMSVGDYRDQDGISYESFGVPPDIRLVNTTEDLENNVDNVLEAAIDALQ
ncbi:MAG: S41 family peptidase, partial [Bacteroidota bacterium]